MQEKVNVVKGCLLDVISTDNTFCWWRKGHYFCDSYYFSLWIKQDVKGSPFLTSLQNYSQILIVSARDLLRNMGIE